MKKGLVTSLLAMFAGSCMDAGPTGVSNDAPAQSAALEDWQHQIAARLHTAGVVSMTRTDWATLYIAVFLEESADCESTVAGGCELLVCDDDSAASIDAGDVTFRSLDWKSDIPLFEELATVSPETGYFAIDFSVPDTARVLAHADGNPEGVPGFVAITELPPLGVVLNQPAFTPGQLARTEPVPIDLTSSIPVAWDATDAPGDVTVSIIAFGDGPLPPWGVPFVPAASMTCRFDSSNGNAEVPAELMSMVPAGPGDLQLSLVERNRIPGFAQVDIEGQADLFAPDGTSIGGGFRATLE